MLFSLAACGKRNDVLVLTIDCASNSMKIASEFRAAIWEGLSTIYAVENTCIKMELAPVPIGGGSKLTLRKGMKR